MIIFREGSPLPIPWRNMMSEDYRKGYRDGFEDGYEKAKHDLVKTTKPIPFYPDPLPWGLTGTPKCQVCGMTWDKPMGYVCHNPKCPTNISCGITEPTYQYGIPKGANGPPGR